jgi:hypothetical protein
MPIAALNLMHTPIHTPMQPLIQTPTILVHKSHTISSMNRTCNTSVGAKESCTSGNNGVKWTYSFLHKSVVEVMGKGSQMLVDSIDCTKNKRSKAQYWRSNLTI